MLSTLTSDLQHLVDFLRTPTPLAWVEAAISNINLLLLDHAHCERKAAATAINFMSKYPENQKITSIMSPLAREELLHFEKALEIMKARNIPFGPLQPSGYAQRLHKMVRKGACKERLCEELLIGAIIEARSCERFSAIVPYLPDQQLQKFYTSLLRSEARHFENYLDLANDCDIQYEQRLNLFLTEENKLISGKDTLLRFHSGIPCS